MATTLQHGSHVHPLKLIKETTEMEGEAGSCRACGLPFTSENDDLYGCRGCGFFLHRFCAMLSPSLKEHPAHHQHPLYLLYAPADLGCDICGKAGGCSGFIYHCQSCSFGAHPLCAHMARTVRIRRHQHPLQFLFRSPAEGSTRCDACKLQIRHCCYKCSNNCDFALHPGCLGENKQRATDSKKKRSARQMLWGAIKWVARKTAMHLLLDGLGGMGEVVDVLLFGADDLAFFADLFSAFFGVADAVDGINDLSGVDLVPRDEGDRLLKEAAKLLRAHMKVAMAVGETSSSSKPPSTSPNDGTITKGPAT